MTRWTILWIVAWAGLFVVMHTPVPRRAPPLFQYGDLIIHFCAYFVLALLGARSTLSRGAKIDGRWLVKWVIIYAVYAAADELLQAPVGRSPELMDWFADVAGAAAALGMAYLNRPIVSESDSS